MNEQQNSQPGPLREKFAGQEQHKQNAMPASQRQLLIAQSFGAFNDNALKMIFAFLAIRAATS